MDKELQKFLKGLEKSKQKARKNNDFAEEAKLCNVAGEKLAEHRLYEQAIEEHQRELTLSECIGDSIAVAISHRKLGECLCELQNFEQALFHQKEYLLLSRKASNIVEEQRALATIGRTYFVSAMETSGMTKAKTAFLESLALCDQLRNIVTEKELLEMRARLYLNLGLVNNHLRNSKKCMKYIEKALAIATTQNLKDTEYRCHFSLGEIKRDENHPAEALQCFVQARKVAQHQGKKFDEADTLVQMGQVLLHLGDFKAAKNILKKCFKTMKHENIINELRLHFVNAIKGTRLLERIENFKPGVEEETQMKTYEDLGDLYFDVKCPKAAINSYLKQNKLANRLKISGKERAKIYESIALSYFEDKQYEKSKEYFGLELKFQEEEPLKRFDTWCNIAVMSKLAGDSDDEIEKALDNALKCSEKCQNGPGKPNLLGTLSNVREKLAKSDNNEELFLMTEKLIHPEEDSKGSESYSEEQSCGDDDNLIAEEMEFSDSDEENDSDKTPAARSKRKSVYKRNEKGETLLHVAAIKDDYNLAKTSIEKGINVHERDYCGWQPLHEACNYGNTRIVELLLDNGADINDPGGPHCRGMTPLHDATQNGHIDVVKLLLSRGASVSERNMDGDTALDCVLNSKDDVDDDLDDESDSEISEVREELVQILTNAASSGKHQPRKVPELRRRDKLYFSDESDEELTPNSSDSVYRSTAKISRKRKSVLLEESDEESSHSGSRNFDKNKPKHSKVSKKSESWFDEDSQSNDSESRMGITRIDSDHSETSRDDFDDSQGINESLHSPEAANTFVSKPTSCLPQATKTGALRPLFEATRTRISPNHPPSSNNNNTRFCSLSTKNTTNATSISGTPNIASRTTNDISKTRSSLTLSNSVISGTFPRNAYVDPMTGSTQEERPKTSQAALVSETEYLASATDAWLVDDMPKKSGKRKRSGNILSMLNRSVSPRDSPASSRVHSGSTRTIGSDTQRPILPTSTQKQHNSRNNNRTRLRQTRINVVSGRSSPNDFWDSTPPESATTSWSSGVSSTPDTRTPMRLRVKIKEKMFLIPCPSVPGERKNVKWLAEQATLRYHSNTGLKPVLSLFTTEGAALSPDDLITDVLSNNEQVNATVENWDLPPLRKRYEDACVMANTDVLPAIIRIFEGDPHISNVQLNDMSLTSSMCRPIFRALQCHDQVTRLVLSGNKICDDGLQDLIVSMQYLPNLFALILSCNGITYKGLQKLASSLSQDEKISKSWSNLKHLDFSFNTITDHSSPSLATMLRFCPGLQILNLESCGLGGNTFHQRSTTVEALQGLRQLHDLNISHNQIPSKGLSHLLTACSSVVSLNLSSLVLSHDHAFADVITQSLDENSCCVKRLICRDCCLEDEHTKLLSRTERMFTSLCELDLGQNNITNKGVFELFRALMTNRHFTHLKLSGNTEITNESLLKLLTLPKLQHLTLSSCGLTSPLQLVNDVNNLFAKHIKYLDLSYNSINELDVATLQSSWRSKWREQSLVSINNSNIILSVRGYED